MLSSPVSTSHQWQLSLEAAHSYSDVLVPHVLGPAARVLVDAAGLRHGQTVVDLGCGPGAAARLASGCVGRRGRVFGIDCNPAMLEVARSLPVEKAAAPIDWIEANALALPLPDALADIALCAQTLQFVSDRHRAISELHRILKPGGRILISVWSDLGENPYFKAFADSAHRHLGPDVASGFLPAFALASPASVTTSLTSTKFSSVAATVVNLRLALPALDEFVPRHFSATPMAAAFAAADATTKLRIVDDIVAQLLKPGANELAPVPFSLRIVSGVK